MIDTIGHDPKTNSADPGNGFEVCGIADGTKDHSMVRKCGQDPNPKPLTLNP